jgi:Spy/CpxP family protein refolding chaperone
MRKSKIMALMAAGLLLAAGLAIAQRQGPRPGQGPGDGPPGGGRGGGADDTVARMMSFDANHDGKLTRAEVTDDRLVRLFDRSDANKDGTVTKEELAAETTRENAKGGGGFGGGGPFGGPGGPRGGGPPGGFMGMPRPGEILPGFLRGRLNLSESQQADLEDLQKEVDEKLNKILTSEQRAQLKEMRDRGPGGFGGPGGRGPGGPGGRGPGRPRPPGIDD